MFKRHSNAPLPRKQRYVRKLILCVKAEKQNPKKTKTNLYQFKIKPWFIKRQKAAWLRVGQGV